MNRIINLLNEKNHYLENFYSLNETELENFKIGDFNNLDYFYNTREGILKAIAYIDAQIHLFQKNNEHYQNSLSDDMRKEIKMAFKIKEEYVARILESDLHVLSCIETAKTSIIRELQNLHKDRKAVAGYKSPDFSTRLNEEA